MDSDLNAVTIIGWIEEVSKVSFHLSFNGVLLFGPLFILYIAIGFLGVTVGLFDLPYPFLSLETDPLFNIFATSIGALVCIMTSALIFLTKFVGYKNQKYEIVMISSFIGLGFGASILRITVPNIINIFTQIL